MCHFIKCQITDRRKMAKALVLKDLKSHHPIQTLIKHSLTFPGRCTKHYANISSPPIFKYILLTASRLSRESTNPKSNSKHRRMRFKRSHNGRILCNRTWILHQNDAVELIWFFLFLWAIVGPYYTNIWWLCQKPRKNTRKWEETKPNKCC